VKQVRLTIVGLAHDHIRLFLPELLKQRKLKLAGIEEQNRELAAQIAELFHIETDPRARRGRSSQSPVDSTVAPANNSEARVDLWAITAAEVVER
jgi:hypothetical protein